MARVGPLGGIRGQSVHSEAFERSIAILAVVAVAAIDLPGFPPPVGVLIAGSVGSGLATFYRWQHRRKEGQAFGGAAALFGFIAGVAAASFFSIEIAALVPGLAYGAWAPFVLGLAGSKVIEAVIDCDWSAIVAQYLKGRGE